MRHDSRLPVPDDLRGAILALGNFDGFHLGHQAVVEEAVRWAQEEGRPVLVATFDPHPVRFFKPDVPPFRLTTLDQREELFTRAGASAMLVFAFDAALASTTAEEFVAHLAGPLGAVGVVTGEDFTFGQHRYGDVARLKQLGEPFGLATRTVAAVVADGYPVSSSRVREALREGSPEPATRLMTRPFAVRGPVIHGAKQGRELGFPTLNQDMASYLRPAYGVYAVTARLPDGREIPGAANLGIRPSFEPPVELLETYLFDFAGDLYDQEIEVALHYYLRPELKFDDMDALKEQMAKDCEKARDLLRARE